MSKSEKSGKCAFVNVKLLKQLLDHMEPGRQACIVGGWRHPGKHPANQQLMSCLAKVMKQLSMPGKMRLGIMSLVSLKQRRLEIGLIIVPDGRIFNEVVRLLGFRIPIMILGVSMPKYPYMGSSLEVAQMDGLRAATTMFPLSDLVGNDLTAVQGPHHLPANLAAGPWGRRSASTEVGGMTST